MGREAASVAILTGRLIRDLVGIAQVAGRWQLVDNMLVFFRRLAWTIKTRWIMLTWHPVRDRAPEYDALIKEAVRKARIPRKR